MKRPAKETYYMDIAEAISKRSNCIKRQIGALVVVDDMIVATGYNGTPRGHLNCFDGGCQRCGDPTIASGTRLEECLCIHAEMNCMAQAAYRGASLYKGTLYSMMSPCIQCAKLIVSVGIMRVVYREVYPSNGIVLLEQFVQVDSLS